MIPTNFPVLLWEKISTIYPHDLKTITQGFSLAKRGSFRINTLLLKNDDENILPEEIAKEFSEKNIVVQKEKFPHTWSFDPKDGFAIKGSDAFYQGKIYLQSLSSMIPVLCMNLENKKKDLKILDMCAAPGSKTSQMAMALHNEGSIMALEKNRIRYDKLLHTLKIQGVENTKAIKTDALKYCEKDEEKYDYILLDAPCSSEGRMSFENEKSYGFWKLEIINQNADLQKQLLKSGLSHLETNGELIYSTCTLSPEENEAVISEVLAEFPNMKIVALPSLKISAIRKGLTEFQGAKYLPECVLAMRVIPSVDTEGFFVARIKNIGYTKFS